MAASSTSSRAVVTLAIGDAAAPYHRVTHPSMAAYAERCGADFVVLRERKLPDHLPHFEKFQLLDCLDAYARILFLDGDILPTDRAPDVFEEVPETAFAAVDVSRSRNNFAADVRRIQELCGSLGWEWYQGYFNSGVMVFSRRHRDVFRWDGCADAWAAAPDRMFNDQTLLNFNVRRHGVEFEPLPAEYNHTPVWHGLNRFESFFIHYAGPYGFGRGTREQQIRRDHRVLASPFRRAVRRHLPLAGGLLDRLPVWR